MNFTPFYDLSKQALRYMNPENDWRFMHADSLSLYNLMSNLLYKSSVPTFEHYHPTLFEEIRKNVGMNDAIISNLTLVRAGEYTLCHEMKRWSGVIMIEGEAYAAIYSGNYDSSVRLAKRAIALHSPHLNHWHNYDAFGFNVDPSKVLFPGGRPMNFYPKSGAVFYYFKIDDKYMEKRLGN